MKIYNPLGQEIAELIADKLDAGTYQYVWDASTVAGGMYFYTLVTENGFRKTKKCLYLK